jgi:hypothetical protein
MLDESKENVFVSAGVNDSYNVILKFNIKELLHSMIGEFPRP